MGRNNALGAFSRESARWVNEALILGLDLIPTSLASVSEEARATDILTSGSGLEPAQELERLILLLCSSD